MYLMESKKTKFLADSTLSQHSYRTAKENQSTLVMWTMAFVNKFNIDIGNEILLLCD